MHGILYTGSEKPGNWTLAMLDRIGLDGILAKVLDWRANLANKGGLRVDDFPMIPGILPILDQLSGHYPMAIVSARNGVTTNNFLRANELENYFKVVIHSQSLRRTKPFPDPLLRAAEVLGVDICNCLMIGRYGYGCSRCFCCRSLFALGAVWVWPRTRIAQSRHACGVDVHSRIS